MKNEDFSTTDNAPGHPGATPTWTQSKKDGVGTSISRGSLVWFTISNGIVNEVFYPRIDQANLRDFEFLITDNSNFFEEEKINCTHKIELLENGVPAYKLINISKKGKYTIEKIILSDPRRDVLLSKVQFKPLKGKADDYHLYVLINPHIKNFGYGNDGWIGEYKGIHMLFAQREDIVLALACSVPFIKMSCGYYGFSDGWQDIYKNKKLTHSYSKAFDGNITLTGEIDLSSSNGNFILALAFGNNAAEAGQLARTALLNDINKVIDNFKNSWLAFQQQCIDLGDIVENGFNLYRLSLTVLKTHMDKRFSDGSIASLSIPWGFAKGDDDLGGYHLVWPRDLVESSGGLLAAGAFSEVRKILIYLMSTQEKDGHWPQNMWLDGSPYWHGIQMDETAFPILLANALKKEHQLKGINIWPTIKKAVKFLVKNGPVSQEDRWEEDPGYSPFTLSVEIAALLAAAEFATDAGESQIASYLIELADYWNSNVEKWTYIKNSEIAKKLNIEGYYVRISPPDRADATSPINGYVPIKNRPPGQDKAPFEYIVSPDALALVRFGLRSANDPRIINTVKVIDSMLKTETKTGPVWHRYNRDGYGEHLNGDPFDGIGIGRGWPLLTGERAHYEIAKGEIDKARALLNVMKAQTGKGGLIPEQVWDSEDIPEKNLLNGHPSGSAMPLVWAHAEFIKLLRSLNDRKVFDMPTQTVQRYVINNISSNLTLWRFNHKSRKMKVKNSLRIELLSPATVHWSIDNWKTAQDSKTKDSGLGIHYADLPTDNFEVGTEIVFTFHWLKNDQWEGKDYHLKIE
ncbi:MAG: glycoside hydrolase family 15 protein [Candidatus Odinarchaeota archaeon]